MAEKAMYDEKWPLITIDNFIDGKRMPSTSYMDGFDPSTYKVFLKIADSDANVAHQAVTAASAAFKTFVLNCLL